MIRTEGIAHVDLVVADVERAVRFYREAFGMEERFRDGCEAFLRTPGRHDCLALSEGRPEVAGRVAGITHFGIRLSDPRDIDEAIGAVERAGGRLLARGGDGEDVWARVADLDGYRIDIFCD